MGKKPKGEETGFLTLTSVWFDNAHIFRGPSGSKVSNLVEIESMNIDFQAFWRASLPD